MVRETVNGVMERLGIPYQYGEYEDVGDGIPDCYFVGLCQELPVSDESGMQGGQFVLSGWGKTPEALATLLTHCKTLRAEFDRPVHVSGEGGAVVLEYSRANEVPSDAEGVHRIEINLDYHEWRVI